MTLKRHYWNNITELNTNWKNQKQTKSKPEKTDLNWSVWISFCFKMVGSINVGSFPIRTCLTNIIDLASGLNLLGLASGPTFLGLCHDPTHLGLVLRRKANKSCVMTQFSWAASGPKANGSCVRTQLSWADSGPKANVSCLRTQGSWVLGF